MPIQRRVSGRGTRYDPEQALRLALREAINSKRAYLKDIENSLNGEEPSLVLERELDTDRKLIETWSQMLESDSILTPYSE
jgi:hypothetical protein